MHLPHGVEPMLDEMHLILPTSWDKNSYTLGRMGRRNESRVGTVGLTGVPRIGGAQSCVK
jgi:hypothetical protein